MKIRYLFLSLSAFLALSAAREAHAATNGFVVPPFRGSADSQSGYWETFTIPVGLPGNLARAGATTSAVLTQSETNGFLTGSGNIYNLNGASEFTLADTTPFALGTVILQTRTLGGELDYSAVTLTYSNASGAHSLPPLPRVELNRGNQPGLGTTASSLWQWDLSGLDVTNYTIAFRAAAPSLSFDSLTLDTSIQFAPLFTQSFALNSTEPSIERWMYANNAAPCDRPAGSSFGTLGDDAGVDTRHSQHLVGWDTASLVPTNNSPTRYLVRRCRLTLTINRGNLFTFDPTQDDFRTYFETNHPAYLPDLDTGRSIELFGVGFRNGYDSASFDQCALFGTNAPAERNSFAAGWSTNGTLVDVSNNVGKTNEAYPRFEVTPFSVGQTTNAAAGQLVPAGAQITFDLNLTSPFVLEYLRDALSTGRLRLMVSSLHGSGGQFGTPRYPDFATHFNEAVLDPSRLEIEGVVISAGDLDADGLPDDWELFYQGQLTAGATDDSDGDGASNLAEWRAGTNPASAGDALRLLPFNWDSAGHAVLRWQQTANRRYAVDFTEDFQTWQTVANPALLFLEPGVAQWRDDSAPVPNRSYRVRLQQP